MEKLKIKKVSRIKKSITKKRFRFESYIAGKEYAKYITQTLGNAIIGY